jgi:ADP-L-glycero-D-manno-heptose 6-epimerase
MYLVTGATGFIGSNILAALSDRGARIAACDTFGDGDKWKNIAKHAVHELIAPDDLPAFLERNGGVLRAVIHMGAISSTMETDVDLIASTNFDLSARLWDFATRAQIPFIYASSAAVYGDGADGFVDRQDAAGLAALRPLNPYGWSKLAFDRRTLRCVADGEPAPPKWAGLRFFNVYGPNEYHKGSMRSVVARNFAGIAAGEPLRLFRSYRNDYSDGGQQRDFIAVQDCVSVVLWMLDTPFASGLYNVGTGEARTWLDLGHAMFSALGIAPKIEFIEMPAELRARYQYSTKADISRLRNSGFTAPMMSLDDGVATYVKNFLSRTDPYR